MTEHRDVADMIIATLRAHGVKRMFGVPGGGSSLDLIEADARHGIDFILTRTEAAATIAASVTGEMTGAPGAALVTKGPGTASAMNGFAYASLDRAPLVVFTDGFAEELSRYARHQFFDQMAMTAPVTKGHGRLEGTNPADEFARLVEATLTPPKGPVHIEITARAAQAPVGAAASPAPTGVTGRLTGDVEAARALLARSERPVIAVGLEARETREAAALERLVEALGCPVLTTYKAKGTIPHDDPRFVGIITNGAVEGACIEASDLLILYGLDPVEFISRPWRYDIPVLDLALWRHQPHYMEMEAGLYGDLVEAAEALAGASRGSEWDLGTIAGLRETVLERLRFAEDGSATPSAIIEAANAALPDDVRITVDAGCHMFSAMAFCKARRPFDVLISNGLATMAFALPAAIASALEEPERPVVCFTGDGGLAMCMGELETIVRLGLSITVVVFNDGSLSLIDVKQQARQMETLGSRWQRPDFAATARGLGFLAIRVEGAPDLEPAYAKALAHAGPALIDVIVDSAGYLAQNQALRG